MKTVEKRKYVVSVKVTAKDRVTVKRALRKLLKRLGYSLYRVQK